MGFSETYREERLLDRRSRGRKARIAGRIIGFGLTACLIVAIRTDPELRAMVDDAALAMISSAMPQEQEPAQDAAAMAQLALEPQSGQALDSGAASVKSAVAHMPESRVKIHRGGIIKE